MFRLARAVVCVLFAAGVAQAQVTTSNVWVRINGPGCSEVRNVSLVMDDDDPTWFTLDNTGACVWTADIGDANRFSTKYSHFSLRFDSGRMDCRQATASGLVAQFQFFYSGPAPFHDLRVTTEPSMPVSYLRRLEPNQQGGIACTEVGAFPAGSGQILRTQLSGEKIDLQFGLSEPKRPILGLLLNGIVIDKGTLILKRDGVTYRLLVQRAQGKAWIAPTLSSNAISLDDERLDQLKLKRVEIASIK
jgi:hypothetical protein